MVKILFILINSVALLFISLFSADGGVTVTGNIPTTMAAGQDVPIEIKINKGSMNGFAKLQVELPEGFTVKSSEDMGATYSLNERTAKWVWATLPQESEMMVKLVVVPSESSLGPRTITAKYSYVENNVKQVAEMTPAEFVVTGAGDSTVAGVLPKNTDSTIVAKKDSLVDNATAQVTSINETPGSVTASRKIEEGPAAGEKLITITIKKGLTKGFARYSDELAEGIIVKDAKTDGASFSVSDGRLKFVWVTVPEKEELEISYVMSGSTQAVKLAGEYSYLEDNQSKKFVLPEETANVESSLAKQSQPETENKEPEKTGDAAATRPVAKTSEKLENKEADMTFHVQIGAFSKKKVTVKKLEKKFNISEVIRSEMQGGFTKFMVGSHAQYREARDHRETMITGNGVKTAFVVAYNHGKRITVQEALMVSNQKWFR